MNMRKVLQLATAAVGLSVFALFGVIINDDFQLRRWSLTEEKHVFGSDNAEKEVSMEDDSFAGRRRHLDSVCEKYEDVYRPEYYNLYREVFGGDNNFALRNFVARFIFQSRCLLGFPRLASNNEN